MAKGGRHSPFAFRRAVSVAQLENAKRNAKPSNCAPETANSVIAVPTAPVNGERRTVNGERRTVNGERRTVNAER
jgi:hypothetical protein